ncbi:MULTISPECIES: GNAT family N-acetyltransferase [Moorena]|uniref:GNAT family acetyltransferase n=2 Tax=Moorena TaxID=1155738 RepID=F4Y140_9CYAN|nr:MULTISPECIES: GNAT family N-acetyltransferase [Moorena]AEE88214.1 putative GNAT family acetyltransferase [Moorena producens 3L]EGJ29551.1 GNAT family acetyltransferase [Moorena producens 3L]NEP67198.1 GNAT family N-acetyltransferase [Moorena sp. SIO3A5]OLT67994.1 N-acetyltransferase [Moorena producens 3L]
MTITPEDNFQVRPMTKDDIKIALSWAVSEGWNPGIDDADNYYIADPGGFLIGELNGKPISSISVVRYEPQFNFIGLYIVKPEERKKGFGLKTWQEALNLISGQPAALYAVLEQVNNYQKFGFKPAHYNFRYQGIIVGTISPDVRDLKSIDFEQLCRYGRRYFPSHRSHFLSRWINQPHGQGYAILNDGELAGYGVIRKATDGFKIGPIFAENEDIAEKLFLALATYAEGSPIYVDVPNLNKSAIILFENYQMNPMFECIAMYTAEPPNIDWHKVFAVTSVELG